MNENIFKINDANNICIILIYFFVSFKVIYFNLYCVLENEVQNAKKRKLNPTTDGIKKVTMVVLCFLPFLIMLLNTREYFRNYLLDLVLIILMGIMISIIFPRLMESFNYFMSSSYDEMIFSKYPTYYLSFIINAFLLTFAISILFYNENIHFWKYSYPALVFLCASRILRHRYEHVLKEFVEIVHGLVIIVILFAFMRLMGILSKFEDTSLFAMSFVNIPIITIEDIRFFVLLSISVWTILSISERLMLVMRKPR